MLTSGGGVGDSFKSRIYNRQFTSLGAPRGSREGTTNLVGSPSNLWYRGVKAGGVSSYPGECRNTVLGGVEIPRAKGDRPGELRSPALEEGGDNGIGHSARSQHLTSLSVNLVISFETFLERNPLLSSRAFSSSVSNVWSVRSCNTRRQRKIRLRPLIDSAMRLSPKTKYIIHMSVSNAFAIFHDLPQLRLLQLGKGFEVSSTYPFSNSFDEKHANFRHAP
jgi:hypothetical protein